MSGLRLLLVSGALVGVLLTLGGCGGGDDTADPDPSEAPTSAPQTIESDGSEAAPGTDPQGAADEAVADCPVVSKAAAVELLGADYEVVTGSGAGDGGAGCELKLEDEEYPTLEIYANPSADSSKAARFAVVQELDADRDYAPTYKEFEHLGAEAFSRFCCEELDVGIYSVEAFRGSLEVTVTLRTAVPEQDLDVMDLVTDIAKGVLDEY